RSIWTTIYRPPCIAQSPNCWRGCIASKLPNRAAAMYHEQLRAPESRPRDGNITMNVADHEDEELNPFRVSSRREILALLRNIGERNQLVRMVIDQGADTIVTSILDVDDGNDTMLLDCAPTPEMNRRVLEGKTLSFETMLDSIRILFTSSDAESCMHEGLPAFVVPLPPHLIRLQRREFYRGPTPVTTPVLCTVPVRTDTMETVPVVTTLYNISGGGIAIMDEKKLLDTTFGRIYEDCRVELP